MAISDVTTTERTDAEIILASLQDPAKFGTLFDRHVDAIYGYLARRLGSDLAEEISSQTFAGAFEHRAQFDGRTQTALPWLYGIATNLLRHHFRAEKRRFAMLAKR